METKLNRTTLYLIIGVLSALLVVLAIAYYVTSPQTPLASLDEQSASSEDPALNPKQAGGLIFEIPSSSWEVNTTQTIPLSLKDTSQTDNLGFISLRAQLDPTQFELLKIDVGNVWSSSNIVFSSVDSAKGMAELDAGRGFDGQASAGSTLAILSLRVLQPVSTAQITILNNSSVTFLNQEDVTPITDQLLMVDTK